MGLAALFAAAAVVAHAGLPPDLAKAARDYDQAQVKNDKAALERLLAADYHLFNSAGQMQDKESFIADSTAKTWKLAPFKVEEPLERVEGDTAFLGGVATLKGSSAGRAYSSRLRFMDVWARRDGQWVVVFTQATKVAP
jgi:ketosteroid isomerase-like protein